MSGFKTLFLSNERVKGYVDLRLLISAKRKLGVKTLQAVKDSNRGINKLRGCGGVGDYIGEDLVYVAYGFSPPVGCL